MKSIITIFCLFVFVGFTANAQFAGGAGTETDPYQITNRSQLEAIKDNLDKRFLLIADIDLSDANWTPIAGHFAGKLNGAGHKIKNITINVTTNAGLFITLGPGAVVENLIIEGGSITGGQAVGSIAGTVDLNLESASGGSVEIRNCGNSASITGTTAGTAYPSGAGGIVGDLRISNSSLTIASCFNKGNVTAAAAGTAGILGGHSGIGNGTATVLLITDCYSNAAITSTAATSYAAGIGGYLYQSSATGSYTIQNCYAEGSVTGNSTAGGILGRVPNTDGTIIKNNIALQSSLSGDASHAHPILGYDAETCTTANNYYSSTLTGESAGYNSDGKPRQQGTASATVEEAKTAAFYAASLPTWDFTNTWKINEGTLYPTLKWEPESSTAIKSVSGTVLKSFVFEGVLKVAGLLAGEQLNVYDIQGKTVYSKKVKSTEQNVSLPARGIYIVVAGEKNVKVIY
ncbi:MAG: hypothetical protein LBU22_12160 [Dysgonamonadaceae bacterium]|jgi:hypothetical protein|nr:hypothetical protein [Dysgonamonadaceae bacterium]